MNLMEESDAHKFLERTVYAHKQNFGSVDSFLQHSYDTAQRAKDLAVKLGMNPHEAALTGYFHDIGRCFANDQTHTFHEIIGARYIEGEGVLLDISDSQEVCDRLAQSIRSHFAVYEQFGMPEYSAWLPGLRDTNPALLLPNSWGEVVVVCADLSNVNGATVSFQERIADIKERDRKTGNPRLNVVEKAEERLLALERDFETASQTKILDEEQYSFRKRHKKYFGG